MSRPGAAPGGKVAPHDVGAILRDLTGGRWVALVALAGEACWLVRGQGQVDGGKAVWRGLIHGAYILSNTPSINLIYVVIAHRFKMLNADGVACRTCIGLELPYNPGVAGAERCLRCSAAMMPS